MSTSYVCDTIPAARLATASTDEQPDFPMSFEPTPPVVPDDIEHLPPSPKSEPDLESRPPTPPAVQPPQPRKLCVRHQRMADEGTNLKLQQSLDALPLQEREQVNAIWSAFSSSSHPRRALILQGLLTMCCFSQLSLLTEHLAHLIRIDPFVVLPREVNLKILKYLDAISLCRAAQVSRRWKALADDDILWRDICEQHIGQKCTKCGWGLPILEKKRPVRLPSPAPSSTPSSSLSAHSPPLPAPTSSPIPPVYLPSLANAPLPLKRAPDDNPTDLVVPALKRQRSEDPPSTISASSLVAPFSSLLPPSTSTDSVTRPWKDVYCERMAVERNWRRGRYSVRTLKGHTDGVMCLQFSENLSHPEFPVLITGSYDRTVRVWNMETGVELHCLKGHARAVRALQFDEVKLITGSMDNTIKVWDWRTGRCIRTLSGHTEGVLCLNFDSNVLASGGVDSTIKVWNLRTGGAFTLRGHSDWVNSVQLWDSSTTRATKEHSNPSPPDSPAMTASRRQCELQIDPGKMLFSASDDGTVRLWDLTQRSCVRQFTGHVGQVQSMKLLVDECESGEEETDKNALKAKTLNPVFEASFRSCTAPGSSMPSSVTKSTFKPTSLTGPDPDGRTEERSKKPMLISGSLDNTIKMWDIETGKTVRTFFGHIEGVWTVASDKLRLVSGSHDRTIKVWSREEGKCTATLVGHQAAVSCLALGEDIIVSGGDDNDIKIWSFAG